MNSPYPQWNADRARTIASSFADVPGGLLPALHAIQDHFGFVSDSAVQVLADVLNLSRAEVHGVVSFYHDFRREARGRYVVRVCQAEACQAMGSRALSETVRETLELDFHQTSADGMFSLEPVYCLGNCACSPNVMINDSVHGRVDGERVEQLLSECRNGVEHG